VALAVLTFAAGLVLGSGTVAVPGLAQRGQDSELRAQIDDLTAEKKALTERLSATQDFGPSA